ncbi:hypothetical protein J7M28_05660 [bacterium]|nr:hypothetical protein [bacterium]
MNMILRHSLKFRIAMFFLALAALLILGGCVKEVKERRLERSHPASATDSGSARLRTAARSGPVAAAVILDSAAQVPSIYSEKGADKLVDSLSSMGFRASRALSWEEMRTARNPSGGMLYDLAIVVSFRDMPRLDTIDEKDRMCRCDFSASVIEVQTGRVLQKVEKQIAGDSGEDFKVACLNAVLKSASDFAELAAELIRDYQEGAEREEQ